MNRLSHISSQKASAILYLLLVLCCLPTTPTVGQKDDNTSYLQEDQSPSLISNQEWEEWRKKREDSKYWEDIQAVKKEEKKEKKKEGKRGPHYRLRRTVGPLKPPITTYEHQRVVEHSAQRQTQLWVYWFEACVTKPCQDRLSVLYHFRNSLS